MTRKDALALAVAVLNAQGSVRPIPWHGGVLGPSDLIEASRVLRNMLRDPKMTAEPVSAMSRRDE